MKRRKKTGDHHPIYSALSKALGESLPLPDKVTFHIPFDAFIRLRGELCVQKKWSLHRIPFAQCPLRINLWGSLISIYPK